jgi:RNA polymerase sigma-70 factor (ECF subfamily)
VSGDDVFLVRRCLKGDATAMQRLVEQFQADVFGLSVRLLQHRQDAEDVVQEVFLRVFRSLRRWDSRRPLRPWIMGIAVNRCRTWLAQRARRPELVEYLHETASDAASDDGSEMAREIHAAVKELRLEYRSVFTMFHDRGLPYDEIAQALGKPIGTVKTWLHRARLEVLDRLRKRGMISEVGHELP